MQEVNKIMKGLIKMTNQEIINKLRHCGFTANHYLDGVLVSLTTRRINIFEVRDTLSFDVSEEVCKRQGDKVMVRGIDS